MDPVQSDTGGFLRAASNDDVLRFRASTDMIDRHRSIVEQDGIDSKHYSGAFLWGHDSTGGMFGGAPKIENQLGKVIKMSKTRFRREDRKMGKATDVDVRFSKVNPFGVLAQGMVREGVLGNVSISFIPKHSEKREIQGEEIRVYDKIELLEISLVPVPSNPEAQQLVRAMGLELEKVPDLADLGVQRRESDDGNWFFSEQEGWRFRMPPSAGDLEDLVDQTFLIERGIVPADVSKRKAEEGTAWSRPSLGDFTSKSWSDLTSGERRRIMGHFTWAPSGDSNDFTFSDLKLPHHRPSDSRIVFRGVSAAMGALLGARGGVDIPGADRRKVYNHLAAHYRQFDRVPPEFRTQQDPPPDNHGADTGSSDVVSSAVRDWVESQRSA